MAIGSHLKLNQKQVDYLNRAYPNRARTHGEAYNGMPASHIDEDVQMNLQEAALEVETAASIVKLLREHYRLVQNFQANLEATRNGPNRYGSLSL